MKTPLKQSLLKPVTGWFALLGLVSLAGCATQVYENRFFESGLQNVSLANGQQISLGFKAPPAQANCQLVAENSESFTMANLAGTFKRDRGHSVLRERVVETVNQRPQDGINHATLFIPNQYEFAGIPLSDIGGLVGGNQAKIAYYRCVNPPRKS